MVILGLEVDDRLLFKSSYVRGNWESLVNTWKMVFDRAATANIRVGVKDEIAGYYRLDSLCVRLILDGDLWC